MEAPHFQFTELRRRIHSKEVDGLLFKDGSVYTGDTMNSKTKTKSEDEGEDTEAGENKLTEGKIGCNTEVTLLVPAQQAQQEQQEQQEPAFPAFGDVDPLGDRNIPHGQGRMIYKNFRYVCVCVCVYVFAYHFFSSVLLFFYLLLRLRTHQSNSIMPIHEHTYIYLYLYLYREYQGAFVNGKKEGKGKMTWPVHDFAYGLPLPPNTNIDREGEGEGERTLTPLTRWSFVNGINGITGMGEAGHRVR